VAPLALLGGAVAGRRSAIAWRLARAGWAAHRTELIWAILSALNLLLNLFLNSGAESMVQQE
jgi:hypothetical protein